MTPTEVAAKLQHFNDWRRGGDIDQPDPLAVGEAIDAAIEMIEMIERLDKAESALRQHHNLAMGEGFDPSHVLTKLRVSTYQQTNLFANTVAALEESK